VRSAPFHVVRPLFATTGGVPTPGGPSGHDSSHPVECLTHSIVEKFEEVFYFLAFF
jgi:hypothetical protein